MSKKENMLTLEQYLEQHREVIRPRVLPKHLTQYQDNLAENHALLGDRLLDVCFYRQEGILEQTKDKTAEATHLRSEIFSDRNLSVFGDEIHVHLLKPEEWQVLSEKERGTFIEALVAACFCEEAQTFSEQFESLVKDVISRLRQRIKDMPVKNPTSLVHEWLQGHGISSPELRFQTKTLGVEPHLFQTTIDFGIDGKERLMSGPTCSTKDEARRLAAERVLSELGQWDAPLSEVRTVAPPLPPAEIAADTFVRDGTFDTQSLERENWDLQQTLEWFRRKSKWSYETIFLLRAQLDNAIDVTGWVGNLDGQFVAIQTATLDGDRYWAIGASAQSRQKSRRMAGDALLAKVPFEVWIERVLAAGAKKGASQ